MKVRNTREGWSMEKKFIWLVMKQFEKKLREILKSMKHKLNIWMKNEEIIGVEFRQRRLTKGKFHFCEPEKGDIPIGEDEENGFLLQVSLNIWRVPFNMRMG